MILTLKRKTQYWSDIKIGERVVAIAFRGSGRIWHLRTSPRYDVIGDEYKSVEDAFIAYISLRKHHAAR